MKRKQRGGKKAPVEKKAKAQRPPHSNSSSVGDWFNLIGLKTQTIDAYTTRFTFAQRGSLDMVAYSKRGIQEGRTSNKLFLRLDGRENEVDSAKFANYLKQIDDYTTKAYQALKDLLKAQWNDENNEFDKEPILKVCSGYEAAVEEKNKIGKGPLVLCVFPSKWTRCYTFTEKTQQRKPSVLNHLVASTGNSHFIASLYYNTTEFTYDEKKHEISAYTYLNVGCLTWVDQGQDVTVSDKLDEMEKQALEDQETATTIALVATLPKPEQRENKSTK